MLLRSATILLQSATGITKCDGTLIIGTVDRLKISFCKQLFPFSESELSHTFCKMHISTYFTSVFFFIFRGDRSGMDKSSSATCLLYSDVVRGDPSPTWLRKYQEKDEKEAVKRAIKESEIFDFRFINILHFFSIFFL